MLESTGLWVAIPVLGKPTSWLTPYTFIMPSCNAGLILRITYCALPGYRIPWCVIKGVILVDSIILVPPLKWPVCVDTSFQRLMPPLVSTNRACLMQPSSGNLTSYSNNIPVASVVCR